MVGRVRSIEDYKISTTSDRTTQIQMLIQISPIPRHTQHRQCEGRKWYYRFEHAYPTGNANPWTVRRVLNVQWLWGTIANVMKPGHVTTDKTVNQKDEIIVAYPKVMVRQRESRVSYPIVSQVQSGTLYNFWWWDRRQQRRGLIFHAHRSTQHLKIYKDLSIRWDKDDGDLVDLRKLLIV
jgi:hypothetical protein